MWPFNRKRKQRRNYGGAQLNRLTNDWVSQGTSADSEVKNSLRILRNRARALVRAPQHLSCPLLPYGIPAL